ncbi:MAG: FtsQ-type POTRA domain-containing protein [Bacilli bacterium]|nr:FtsQ-type POTRA domain-containing protein [Bacilli bacterium]
MKKKKNKVRKIFKIFGFLVILALIALIVYLIINIKIKNIYVKGTKTLTDEDIIELAGIENYPKLFSISTIKMENKIKLNPLIKSVRIRKNIFGRVDIEIEEYNILLKSEVDNSVYLSNDKKITIDEKFVGIPTLINVVPDDILKDFLKKIDTIDKDVLAKISEVEYKPNEFDNELFLFYMNDGNYVYINTTRLSYINKYESMLEQLEGKKGIIYLDSGNHFTIIE